MAVDVCFSFSFFCNQCKKKQLRMRMRARELERHTQKKKKKKEKEKEEKEEGLSTVLSFSQRVLVREISLSLIFRFCLESTMQ